MNRTKALVAWTLLATTLLSSVGCYQTHMGGMTLPSGHYFKDRAEWFAPMPDFPLPRELATMQRQAAESGYYTPPAPRAVGAGGRFAAPQMPAPVDPTQVAPLTPMPAGAAPVPGTGGIPSPAMPPPGGGAAGNRAPG